MIDTIRIGHMIGPPLRKLSIRKLPVTFTSGAGAAEAELAGDGLRLTGTLSPGAGEASAPAGDVPTAGAGDMPFTAGVIGAPGCVGAIDCTGALAGGAPDGGGEEGRF
jgi:hypothetical protein